MHHAPSQKIAHPQEQQNRARKHPPTFWQSILMAIERKVGHQVPLILQMNAVECGAACLAMILGYYGCKISIAELRDRSGVGRDGLSAYHIVQLARVYGLRVRAVSLSSPDLSFVHWPAIVHWQFKHFLLVERWSEYFVDVVDPATGRKRLTTAEFDADFTGIVIMLEPGEDFISSRPRQRITLRTYVAQYIKHFPAILWQIIAVSLILQAFGLLVPLLTKVVVDQIIPFKMSSILLPLGLGILIFLFAQLVTMFLRASLLTYLQAQMDTVVSSAFFEHLLKLSPRFFQLRSSGDLLNRAASNTLIRDLISSQLVSTLLDGSLVVVYMLILFSQSLIFGSTVLLTGLLQVVLLLASYRSIRLLTGRELEAEGKAQGYVAEMLTGIETLKAAGAEQHAFQQWSNLFFEQLNIALRRDYLTAAISTCIITLSALSPLLFLLIGAADVLNGSMQLGTMLALNALAGAFLAPLAALVQSGQQLQTINSHLQRISDVMEAEPEQDLSTVQQPHRLTGHVALEHVSFQYDVQGPKVLDDIVLKVKPGEKIALVGRTGSGKTTLGKLLLGLCLPTEGQITYDDVSLNALDYQAVRAQFGTVLQDAHIFSGTLRQNIAFNNPAMDMERIMKAAQLAELHADISQWPLGYETFVAEGGRALSGGQCQRLALARALANEPAILLLDEATSALDVVTEYAIEQNLHSLSCTQIIIAHRLSTIQHADTILVLDQGKIVEQGSHTQLLAHNGHYARLIHNQLQSSNSNDSHLPLEGDEY